MKKRFVLPALVLLASSMVAASASADLIAFDCDYDICTVDPDTGGVQNLTKTSGEDSTEYSPSFSPDGKSIAYIADYNGPFEPWVVDASKTAEESEAIRVIGTGISGSPETNYAANGTSAPAWSPDGSRIAFYASWSGGGEDSFEDVIAASADGVSGATVVGKTTHNEEDPSWTPDGQIVFYRSGGGVQIGPAASAGPFAPIAGAGIEPIVSPDGKYVAGGTFSSYPYSPVIARTDGSGAVTLEKNSTLYSGDISWSPDSTQVVYVDDEEPSGGNNARDQVWVAPVDKSNPGHVVAMPEGFLVPHDPSFSPDGTRIAFGAQTNTGEQILVGPADGSAPAHAVTTTGTLNQQPFWKPCEGCAPPAKKPAEGGTEKKTPQKVRLAAIKQVFIYPKLLVFIDCFAQGGHPDPKYCHGDGIMRGQAPAGGRFSITAPWGDSLLKKAKPKSVVFAKGSVKVPGGQNGQLKMKVTAAGKKLAKPGKTIKVQIVVKVSRDTEKPETFKQTVKVKVPKKK